MFETPVRFLWFGRSLSVDVRALLVDRGAPCGGRWFADSVAFFLPQAPSAEAGARSRSLIRSVGVSALELADRGPCRFQSPRGPCGGGLFPFEWLSFVLLRVRSGISPTSAAAGSALATTAAYTNGDSKVSGRLYVTTGNATLSVSVALLIYV